MPDRDAAAIGELYARSRDGIVESMHLLVEAGERLAAKKASLPHGQWLPWLEANAGALGFKTRQTAHKLMKCAEKANVALAQHLDAPAALALSREVWGHAPARPAALKPAHPGGLFPDPDASPEGRKLIAALRRMRSELRSGPSPAELQDRMRGYECYDAAKMAREIADWLDELAAVIEATSGVREVTR